MALKKFILSQKAQPEKNFISIIGVSDDAIYMLHFKNGSIVERISIKKIEEIGKISSYLRQHKSTHIYVSIYDSAIRIEKKYLPSVKDITSMRAIQERLPNTLCVFTQQLTHGGLGKQVMIAGRLDKMSVHKNIAGVVNLAIKIPNPVWQFEIIQHDVNLWIRDLYKFVDDHLVYIIIASKEGQIYTALCAKNVAISLKTEKSHEDLQKQINDEIDKINSVYSRHEIHKDIELPDHVPDIVVLTDIEALRNAKFQSLSSECRFHHEYFQGENQELSIVEYATINSIKYHPVTYVVNNDIIQKMRIFKAEKVIRLGALIISSLSLAIAVIKISTYSVQNELAISQKKHSVKEVEQRLPPSEELEKMSTLMLLKNMSEIYKISLSANWGRDLDAISKILSNASGAYLTKYTWNCAEKCLTNSKRSLDLTIDFANSSGYLQTIYHSASYLNDNLQRYFGDNYTIKGLNYKYQVDIERQYFYRRMNINIYPKNENDKPVEELSLKDMPVHAGKNVSQDPPLATIKPEAHQEDDAAGDGSGNK